MRGAGEVLYLAGLVFAEGLRFRRRIERVRSAQSWHAAQRSRVPEAIVLVAIALGIWVLPFVFICTPWLRSFDYSLPEWASGIGAAAFALSLVVRWRAQTALGRQWSFTLETARGHALVTQGIFAWVRHPIYVSLLLWALAQPLLLQNAVAGVAGAIAVALIWFVRVPREERMMLETFGDEYRRYMARTGRFFPKR